VSNSTAYDLGKWVAGNKLLTLAATGVIVYLMWPAPYAPLPKPAALATPVAVPAKPQPPCTNDLEERLAKAKEKVKSKDNAAAVALLEPCRPLLTSGSDAAKTLEAAALAAQRAAAQAEALERKRELAQWRKEGVSLGMTSERVLLSNWGRPQKVNRTTTAGGVHEQWVYDGGYLYFQDGILTSIQN
jgi:hypothetical protein